MKKNVIKRYSGIRELEKELEDLNDKGYFIQSISDCWTRILAVYVFDENFTLDNTKQDETIEDTLPTAAAESESVLEEDEGSWPWDESL